MSFENSDLIDRNLKQLVSESDDFTPGRYTQFADHFPSHAKDMLDIGCNTGRGGRIIKSRMPHLRITGLDCVPQRLENIDRNVYDSVICGFANDVPAPSNSFDVIVAGEIIEHIPGIAVFPTLCEALRLLRLKGKLMLTTPNPHYLRNRLQNLSVLTEASHVSQHTVASMRRKLEDAGFSQIRMFGSGRMTRYIGQHFPWLSVYGSYLAVATKW